VPLKLYSQVVLNRSIPDEGLLRGDVAMYIEFLPMPDGDHGAILEIFNALGEEVSLATVPLDAIESLRAEHIPSVRIMEQHS